MTTIAMVALLAMGALAACSSDGGNRADRGQQGSSANIVRVPLPESPFVPEDLEATINAMVDVLDTVPPQRCDVSLVTSARDAARVGADRALGELRLGGRLETAVADTANAAPDPLPVIVLTPGEGASQRQLFIGTDAGRAGRAVGSTLVGMLPKGPGTVYVLGTDSFDWADGYARSFAAADALQEAGYTPIVHRVGWEPNGTQRDFDVLTVAIPAANPPVVGCLGVFSNAFRCVDVVKKIGYAPGQITIAAFDLDPTTVRYMQQGWIQATHAQRPYYMGYLVPYALYSLKALGLPRTMALMGRFAIGANRVDTGVDVVLANQLDAFNAFLDALGISG